MYLNTVKAYASLNCFTCLSFEYRSPASKYFVMSIIESSSSKTSYNCRNCSWS